MAHYFKRYDSMTQATAVYAAVETDAVGAVLSTIKVPRGVRRVSKVIVAVVLNAAAVVTGAIYIVKLHGKAVSSEQEIVVYKSQFEGGAGTLTDTKVSSSRPAVIPCNIAVIEGNDLQISAAYVGTDPGTPLIDVTVELS